MSSKNTRPPGIPGIDGQPPLKQSERTPSENKERAFIAASRRSDRSIEARLTSAEAASKEHYRRTGKRLNITMEVVRNEEMYEEIDDMPRHYRNMYPDLPAKFQDFAIVHTALHDDHAAFVQRERNINSAFEQMFPGIGSTGPAALMGPRNMANPVPNAHNVGVPQQSSRLNSAASPMDRPQAQNPAPSPAMSAASLGSPMNPMFFHHGSDSASRGLSASTTAAQMAHQQPHSAVASPAPSPASVGSSSMYDFGHMISSPLTASAMTFPPQQPTTPMYHPNRDKSRSQSLASIASHGSQQHPTAMRTQSFQAGSTHGHRRSHDEFSAALCASQATTPAAGPPPPKRRQPSQGAMPHRPNPRPIMQMQLPLHPGQLSAGGGQRTPSVADQLSSFLFDQPLVTLQQPPPPRVKVESGESARSRPMPRREEALSLDPLAEQGPAEDMPRAADLAPVEHDGGFDTYHFSGVANDGNDLEWDDFNIDNIDEGGDLNWDVFLNLPQSQDI